MGLFNWMRRGTRGQGTRLSQSQQSQVPIFEQLEPRVLLSAEAAGLFPMDILSNPNEQVIEVELYPSGTSEALHPPVETVMQETDILPGIEGEFQPDPLPLETKGNDTADQYSEGELGSQASIKCPVNDSRGVADTENANDVPCLTDENIGHLQVKTQDTRGPPALQYNDLTLSEKDTYINTNSVSINLEGQRVQVGSLPDLPGLTAVDTRPEDVAAQIIYVDFDGAQDVV